MWLAHEDHVLHLGGPLDNVLIFRFPMLGEFTFACDVQDGDEPETHGGLVYGGLQFEPHGRIQKLRIADTSRNYIIDRSCPFGRRDDRLNFNRLSIQSDKRKTVFAVNRESMFVDPKLSQNSPWIGMRSDGRRRPAFRNLAIVGSPTIPSEIDLVEDKDLRGWTTTFFAKRCHRSPPTPSQPLLT